MPRCTVRGVAVRVSEAIHEQRCILQVSRACVSVLGWRYRKRRRLPTRFYLCATFAQYSKFLPTCSMLDSRPNIACDGTSGCLRCRSRSKSRCGRCVTAECRGHDLGSFLDSGFSLSVSEFGGGSRFTVHGSRFTVHGSRFTGSEFRVLHVLSSRPPSSSSGLQNVAIGAESDLMSCKCPRAAVVACVRGRVVAHRQRRQRPPAGGPHS
eukprot:2018690-Rhodomonas_salina.2